MAISKRVSGYHAATWTLIVLVAMLSDSSEEPSTITSNILRIVNYFSLFIATFYFHYDFLVPRYLMNKEYVEYTLFFFLNILIYPFMFYSIYLILKEIFPDVMNEESFGFSFYMHYLSQSIFCIIPSIAVRYAIYGRETQQRAEELAHEKSKAELSALKAQSNPHFLFNAFNSLYALSIKKDEKLPQVLLKLSDMMRYMMDYSQKDKAALYDEVKLIEDYLEIQRLRLDDEFDLKFLKYGDFSDYYITPLILLPLVENCFKHGDLSPEGYIHLTLEVKDGEMVFQTENHIEKRHESNGVGLVNLKKLLNLKYDDSYIFEKYQAASIFHSYLKIPLNGDQLRGHRG